MDFYEFLTEGAVKAPRDPPLDDADTQDDEKCNALVALALSVVKRESEKAELLKLKGYERADIERNRGKHSVVCRHWLKGMCMKGEFCDFLHQLVYSRMPPCRLFEKNGFCIDNQRGNCIFQHIVEQLDANAAQDPRIREAIANGMNFSEISHETDPDGFATAFVLAVGTVFPRISDVVCLEEFIPPSPQPDEALSARDDTEAMELPPDTMDDYNETVQDGTIVTATIPGLIDMESVANDDTARRNNRLEINSRNTKCFMIKSSNMMNIYFSICYGIWATGINNTVRLMNAFKKHEHVVLVFSGNESGGFQGYAKMMTMPIPGLYSGIWGSYHSRLGDNFRVKWIKQCSVEFDALKHITNPCNKNQPLKKSRDGTELPLEVAETICNKLYNSPEDDILKGTPLSTWEKIDHKTYFDELKRNNLLHTAVGLPYQTLKP